MTGTAPVTEERLGLAFPARQAKPRTRGLTMMIDWGIPPGQQADVVRSAGQWIDMAKIAASIPALMDEALVTEKLRIYRENGVSTSQGGLLVELAVMQRRSDTLFANLARLGFDAIEVSDNLLDWSLEEKRRTIRSAIDDHGLRVLGEVGRKEGRMTDDEIIADLDTCFDAGASLVFLEAYELFADETIRGDLIQAIAGRFGLEKVLFELPVTILPGSTKEYKHRVTAWMVRELGTEVNLANVEHDELWVTEMVRRGAGGDTTHPGGAYTLSPDDA